MNAKASRGERLIIRRPIAAADLLPRLPVILEGVVLKRGRLFRTWKPCRLVLKSQALFFYKVRHSNGPPPPPPPQASTNEAPTRVLLLDSYVARLRPDLASKNGKVFSLSHSSAARREFFFCVPFAVSSAEPHSCADLKEGDTLPLERSCSPPVSGSGSGSGERVDARGVGGVTAASADATQVWTRASEWVRLINLHNEHPTLSAFTRLKRIGFGAYGKVYLVSRNSDKCLFALKRVPKVLGAKASVEECRRHAQLGRHPRAHALENLVFESAERERRHLLHLIEERSVLEHLRHPYLLSLAFAFQDSAYFYLGTEFCEGGELFNLARLQPRRRFSEDVVRIWAAELASAIEFMHHHHTAHRDIKSENILLDADGKLSLVVELALFFMLHTSAFFACGVWSPPPSFLSPFFLVMKGHVRLADFGFCKNLRTRTGETGRTYTFCGTRYLVTSAIIRSINTAQTPFAEKRLIFFNKAIHSSRTLLSLFPLF